MRVAGRDPAASTYDLGFVLGPRLNAAGRLDDMAVGIECLISNDPATAERIARELDALNRERRSIEAGMHDNALAILAAIPPQDSYSLCLFDPGWHQGVIGILASRIKERWHRPVIRVRARQRRRNQGFGPLDQRAASARCARSGCQARARPAIALRRPRRGRRPHAA